MDNKKYKILIVDDGDDARTIYKDVFEKEGFDVVEALDGVEGLEKAIKEMPDVVFTGIIMPRMDGFSLKEELSKNVATSNIPVFMNSHMGREEDRKKAQISGIKDFFVVGMITPKEVVVRIKATLEGGNYMLKVNHSDSDAFRLVNDLGLGNGFSCPRCGNEMVLNLKTISLPNKEFSAKLSCPICDGK
ncbi:MAG: response regulator [Candidatus Moranbacteria bacterium]|nr:response regulator [Candidatus Moranbacteria bacterium]